MGEIGATVDERSFADGCAVAKYSKFNAFKNNSIKNNENLTLILRSV